MKKIMRPDLFLDGLDLDGLLSGYTRGGTLCLVWSPRSYTVGWAVRLPSRGRRPHVVIAVAEVPPSLSGVRPRRRRPNTKGCS